MAGPHSDTHPDKPPTKKSQILSLYSNGITNVEELASVTESTPSYVASVLQDEGLLAGYFDLYTHSSHPMNVYSKYYSEKLGFKDEATARASVDLLESTYRQFQESRDRAGQHHALTVALTMFDRARWSGKRVEAELFRSWLMRKLQEDAPAVQAGASGPKPGLRPPPGPDVTTRTRH